MRLYPLVASLVATALLLSPTSAPDASGKALPERAQTTLTVLAKATKPKLPRCSKPAPTTAAQWNRAFRSLGGKYAYGDQGTSLKLPDGRQLFMLGDTVQGTLTKSGGVKNWTLPHSTFVIANRGCLSIHRTTVEGMIPNAANGDYYWPASAVISSGSLYVFADRVRASKGAFQLVDRVLTEFTLPYGGVPKFKRHVFAARTPTKAEPITWGAGTFVKDGYAYIYGNKVVKAVWTYGRDVHLARVPVGQVTKKSAWRYWDGKTWGTNAAAAAVIHPAADGPGATLSPYYDRKLKKYVVIGKKNDFLGDEIIALTSPNPYGPFTEQVLHRNPLRDGKISYSPMAHPQIPLKSGKTFLTYAKNHTDVNRVLRNVELGRFSFLEVSVR